MKHFRQQMSSSRIQLLAITAGVFLIFLFSNPHPMVHFDYTFRIADALLHGRLGMTEAPPDWLNEMVPFEARYYSVFPLGSVLSLVPLAALKAIGVIDSFPAAFVAASIASVAAALFFLLSGSKNVSSTRRIVLSLFPLLATWTWCNLSFAGSWQLALGFAIFGQTGALYFTLVDRRPFLAGLFFALAFGNRTEVLLTAPIFLYFIVRTNDDLSLFASRPSTPESLEPPISAQRRQTITERINANRRAIALFVLLPAALGVATLIYNYVRFHSIFDFGYMRIPQVAQEESFKHGLFSIHSIPSNAHAMLWEGLRVVDKRPYVIPHGFGGSIFLSSPFLILLFRKRVCSYPIVIAAWTAIVVLTLALWLHANPGGWQFSYRYGMILLPWMFLILLDNGGEKTSALEVGLFVLSVMINAYATYLFSWTDYVQP